jgi:hypothetical protein
MTTSTPQSTKTTTELDFRSDDYRLDALYEYLAEQEARARAAACAADPRVAAHNLD